jgi:hypothetical protein
MFDQARRSLTSPDDIKRLVDVQDMFSQGLQRFNLVSLISKLQTFPIGISSLLARNMPVDSPMGQNIVQVTSPLAVLGYMFLLTVLGWFIGGLYFRWVSGTVLGQKGAEVGLLRAIIQTFTLSVLWFMVMVVVSIPVMLVLTVLMLINPLLASGALFIMVMLSFWVIVPLFFVPHGIFVRRQNAFHSIFTSFRMTRFTLPTSGMFVFSSFILSTGLNYLWSVPKSNSWMTLVGISGHAFITTALLAASFVYYRDMNVWLQMVLEELQQKKNIPAQKIE